MKRRRDLLLTNAAAAIVLLVVLAIGWGDAALFGLGVLIVMDIFVVVAELLARKAQPEQNEPDEGSQDGQV